jgi:exoribonuclease R
MWKKISIEWIQKKYAMNRIKDRIVQCISSYAEIPPTLTDFFQLFSNLTKKRKKRSKTEF